MDRERKKKEKSRSGKKHGADPRKKKNRESHLTRNTLSPDLVIRLMAMLSSFLPERDDLTKSDLRGRLALLPSDRQQSYRLARNAFVSEVLGTQMPEVKMPSNFYSVNAVIATPDTTVGAVSWFNIHDYTLWASIFDEYQIHAAVWHVMPGSIAGRWGPVANNTPFIGCIDYDTNGALVSMSGGVSYDTHKIFYCESSTPIVDSVKWEVKPMGIPDLTWYSTATNSSSAWWKVFSGAPALSSYNNAYWYYFTVLVKFRQLIV